MATLQKIRSKGPLLVIVIGLALFAFIAGDAWKVLQPHQFRGCQNAHGLCRTNSFITAKIVHRIFSQLTQTVMAVIQLIGSLVRKGILKTSDTEFYMEDMVEKMIRCIGWPDEDYEIEQENGQIYCYEKEEYALVTKIYPVREKTLELILYSKEEFQQKIRKEEIL